MMLTVEGLDQASVAAAVGARTYSRGVAYARQRAVLHVEWDAAGHALHAVVRGSDDEPYRTAAYFNPGRGARLVFAFGECTCAVGIDCKHVVASAVAAASGRRLAAPIGSARETSLGALLTPAPPAAGR